MPVSDRPLEVLRELGVLLADPADRVAQPALHVDARALGGGAALALAAAQAHGARELAAEQLELVAAVFGAAEVAVGLGFRRARRAGSRCARGTRRARAASSSSPASPVSMAPPGSLSSSTCSSRPGSRTSSASMRRPLPSLSRNALPPPRSATARLRARCGARRRRQRAARPGAVAARGAAPKRARGCARSSARERSAQPASRARARARARPTQQLRGARRLAAREQQAAVVVRDPREVRARADLLRRARARLRTRCSASSWRPAASASSAERALERPVPGHPEHAAVNEALAQRPPRARATRSTSARSPERRGQLGDGLEQRLVAERRAPPRLSRGRRRCAGRRRTRPRAARDQLDERLAQRLAREARWRASAASACSSSTAPLLAQQAEPLHQQGARRVRIAGALAETAARAQLAFDLREVARERRAHRLQARDPPGVVRVAELVGDALAAIDRRARAARRRPARSGRTPSATCRAAPRRDRRAAPASATCSRLSASRSCGSPKSIIAEQAARITSSRARSSPTVRASAIASRASAIGSLGSAGRLHRRGEPRHHPRAQRLAATARSAASASRSSATSVGSTCADHEHAAVRERGAAISAGCPARGRARRPRGSAPVPSASSPASTSARPSRSAARSLRASAGRRLRALVRVERVAEQARRLAERELRLGLRRGAVAACSSARASRRARLEVMVHQLGRGRWRGARPRALAPAAGAAARAVRRARSWCSTSRNRMCPKRYWPGATSSSTAASTASASGTASSALDSPDSRARVARLELAADHRGQLEHRARARRERGEPLADHGAHAARNHERARRRASSAARASPSCRPAP